MNKAKAKKIVLGQLASYLETEIIIDGVCLASDIEAVENAQKELIGEFKRRSGGEEYSADWK